MVVLFYQDKDVQVRREPSLAHDLHRSVIALSASRNRQGCFGAVHRKTLHLLCAEVFCNGVGARALASFRRVQTIDDPDFAWLTFTGWADGGSALTCQPCELDTRVRRHLTCKMSCRIQHESNS